MFVQDIFPHILTERVGRTTVNSLGRPLAGSDAAMDRFWQWFGNSKAVDRTGRPLVLFHGTKADFRAFDPSMSNSNTKTGVPDGAFVFTNKTDTALSYAGQTTRNFHIADADLRDEYDNFINAGDYDAAGAIFKKHAEPNVKFYAQGGNIMPVYLRILKPLRISGRGDSWNDIYHDRDTWTTNDLMQHAKEKGYDSLIVSNVHDRQEGPGKTATTYAVFSPTQIKSALGNNGGFASDRPEIDEQNIGNTISLRDTDSLREGILYRGDASSIDQFDSEKSGWFLLYTPGTYLTDSPEVAGDYTLKGSEHVVFRDEKATSSTELILHYIASLLAKDTAFITAREELRSRYGGQLFDAQRELRKAGGTPDAQEMLRKEWQQKLVLAEDKLRSGFLKRAKAEFRKQAPDLRLARATTGNVVLVKANRAGHISRFDVPDEYLNRTLHAERPMPPKVIDAIRKLWFEHFEARDVANPAGFKMDMRDANGDWQTFDGWIDAYKKTGIDFAWADEDTGRVFGGKGEMPDLDTIWHGTHFGQSWFYDKTNMKKFITAMQALGYVGLEYDGGKRVGQHTRGGGGHAHRAYVFWNDADMNRFRVGSEQVSDTDHAMGLEKAVRNGTRLSTAIFKMQN